MPVYAAYVCIEERELELCWHLQGRMGNLPKQSRAVPTLPGIWDYPVSRGKREAAPVYLDLSTILHPTNLMHNYRQVALARVPFSAFSFFSEPCLALISALTSRAPKLPALLNTGGYIRAMPYSMHSQS